jgi:hypothetical protein
LAIVETARFPQQKPSAAIALFGSQLRRHQVIGAVSWLIANLGRFGQYLPSLAQSPAESIRLVTETRSVIKERKRQGAKCDQSHDDHRVGVAPVRHLPTLLVAIPLAGWRYGKCFIWPFQT